MISLAAMAAPRALGRTVQFGGSGQSPRQLRRTAPPSPPDYVALDIAPDEDDIESASARQETQAHQTSKRGPGWGGLLKLAGILLLGITGILSGSALLPRASAVSPQGSGFVPMLPGATNTTALIPILPPALPDAHGLRPIPIGHPSDLPYLEPARVSGWPNRVELMASSSQNHYSYFSNNGSDYTNALMDIVRRNETHSLGQSNAIMWEQGYPIARGRQWPVSTAEVADSWCLNAWDKRDTHKQRFALLLDGGRDFRRDCRRWRNLLRGEFAVPKRNILYYPDSNSTHVEQGLRKIARTIQTRGLNPEQVEVMVYYSGHGRAFQPAGDASPRRDGDAIGSIALRDGRYTEHDLHDALETYLPQAPTTVILDACQSGAWIA